MYKTGAITKSRIGYDVFFVILNLIDYITTHTLISMDGEELMPLGFHVIQSYGMVGLLLYKLTITLCVLGLSRTIRFSSSAWDLLNGAFTAIVLWNTLGIALGLIMQ